VVKLAGYVGLSALKWTGEAIVTDTTINLALTCILMRMSHAAGINFSLDSIFSNLIESAIHIMTLAYLFIPFLAIIARFMKLGLAKLQALKMLPGTFFLTGAVCSMPKQDLSPACLRKCLDNLCPFQKASPKKFGLLVFWYLVAGHIALMYSKSSSVVAPFGYWYLVVLTLRVMYQVATRQTAASASFSAV